MKRPEIPGMNELKCILQDIKNMEDSIRELKKRIKDIPRQIATQLSSREERLAAAEYLYWMVPEVNAKLIAETILGIRVYDLKNYIGKATGTIACDRCQQPIEFRNRRHRQEILKNLRNFQRTGQGRHPEDYLIICDPCLEDIVQERAKEWKNLHDYKRQYLQRQSDLRTMPYSDYLKTPEWQERRQHHLNSAGYRCQVCNAGDVTLNVHHRTYERRGNERYSDLITLCHPCHELFHREGRWVTQ